jgi:hypothetical protein
MKDAVRSVIGATLALIAGTLVWYALWWWIAG